MNVQSGSFDDSIRFDYDAPITLLQRLDYVRQLVFSKTKVEFKLLWNKIFQKDEEELGWLLNPYSGRGEATMMARFDRNGEDSYQYNYTDVEGALGRERVTIHSRGVVKKEPKKRKDVDDRTLGEKALQMARYMGMGVYMTSTAFPSPYFPVADQTIVDDTFYNDQNIYSFSKLW